MVVPTLQRLAVATLIRFRDALGDIGYAPVELLQDVLAACSPQQLATIEDETLAGTGRTLKPWTWDLWREHWQRQFAGSFGAPASGTPPPLPPAAEVAEGEPGVQPADYRALYERCQAELEQKRAESGARLRALREQAEQERQARHTQVVDAGTMPGRRRRQQQRPGPASSGGRGGSVSHRAQVQPAGSSKDRLLKKLGLGGGGGSGSRHAAVQPRKTVTIIHPARAPAAAAGVPHHQPSTAQHAQHAQHTLPPPSAVRQPMPHGLARSPAGSLASAGSSPLPWQQHSQAARAGSSPLPWQQHSQAAQAGSSPLPWQQHSQAARTGSIPMRQQLHAAGSSSLARQQLLAAGSSPLGQQRVTQQQQGHGLGPAEAGSKPQLVAASSPKPRVTELCSSELMPSKLAELERPQHRALTSPSPQQQPVQPGGQTAATSAGAAAQRKPARPAKPQALEEVDLFAGLEEAPAQPRPPPLLAVPPRSSAQPAQQLSYKRAAERSSGGSKGGGGRGTQPPAKKPRPQQQAEGQLVEVDLFDGL